MNAIAIQVDQTLRSLDRSTAAKLERLVRDALELVSPTPASMPVQDEREKWLERLDRLRASVGTDKPGTSTEEIWDDLRTERF